MNLIEKENCYLFDKVFPPGVMSGFTKGSLEGKLPDDIENILTATDQEFKISYMDQIHSPRVHLIKEEGVYEGDGLITGMDKMVLVVKTADCMPIIFYDQRNGLIGAVHMGWKSAEGGILDNIKFDLSTFKVALGVGLRKCCFRVGPEFYDYPGFKGFLCEKDNEIFLDPVEFAKRTLMNNGLKEENFFDVNICSYCSKENFASRRKAGGLYTKTLSFIVKR